MDSIVVRTTEGWLELFLTPAEKQTFSQWDEQLHDKSITHFIFQPFMMWLSQFIPDTVAPNIVTLAGFLALGQAWYMTNLYGREFPVAMTWFAVVNIVLFFTTNSMEPYHAARLRQQSALGDLFKYSCDSLSSVFLIILTTYCLGGTSPKWQWYAVQASQLVLFYKHLSAFDRHAGLRYSVLNGPGEVLMSAVTLLVVRATFGLDWMTQVYETSIHRLLPWWLQDKYDQDPANLGLEAIMMLYYAMYTTAVIKALLLKRPHGWSRFGILSSLLMRLIPAILLHLGVSFEITMMDVICDGFFMAVLTADLTLAKMAGREIHPWVVLMSLASVLSHSTILTLVLTYYIAVFADLCSYLNMPLLTTCRNVYCDGVYDLCHIGHKTLFQNALSFGNRLYVGVVGDQDASAYKRPPIMSHAERCAEVLACKAVTKVIPNAPCFGLTQEFLDRHQIHVVAFGEEYVERWPDPKDDVYYGYVRRIGIARPMPRTKGLSTSDLIRRIQNAAPADEKKSET
jgi:cytidyltransferase-like protein